MYSEDVGPIVVQCQTLPSSRSEGHILSQVISLIVHYVHFVTSQLVSHYEVVEPMTGTLTGTLSVGK